MARPQPPPTDPRPELGGEEDFSPDVRLALPASLRSWVPALSLFDVVDEPRHDLVVRCLSEPADWPGFRRTAYEVGLVEEGPLPDTLRFRPEWAESLTLGLDHLGGADPVRGQLLDAWLAEPDPRLAVELGGWAGRLRRWDAVEAIWILLEVANGVAVTEFLTILRDLPEEARARCPGLTWASGAAASMLATTPHEGALALSQRLQLDAALLHVDWWRRENTDAAVVAGAHRMLGERRMPATQPGQSLAAAWRTKTEIDTLIDARSRLGQGPGRESHALFRAYSARLAIARADHTGAVSEARWAGILAEREPLQVLAGGLETLATSLFTETAPTHRTGERLQQVSDNLGTRALRGMGEAYEILADAHHAVRSLDRPETERTLALVSADAAAIAGAWAVRAWVQAMHDALWGDPDESLDRLVRETARHMTMGGEQDEPLGRMLLGRARMLFLTRAGAFGAATRFAESLPDSIRLVPLARMHLWAGQFAEAGRLADTGLFLTGLPASDRPKLAVIHSAATLLAGTSDERLRSSTLWALRQLLAAENFVPLGVLPKAAREALLQHYGDELAGEPHFPLLRERLGGLDDAGQADVRQVRLTERERVLLPMLATDRPVPDIARELHVSVNTVRKQVVTLREKFQADTRGELVRRARNHGML